MGRTEQQGTAPIWALTGLGTGTLNVTLGSEADGILGTMSGEVQLVEGRQVLTSLTVTRTRGVTPTFLRSLPLAWLEGVANGQVDPAPLQPSPGKPSKKAARTVRRIVGRGRTGRAWPDELYEAVAELYRTSGSAPTRTIAEIAEVEHSTASRWVREARARELLPVGQKGRAV
jgi:hypothetical protein